MLLHCTALIQAAFGDDLSAGIHAPFRGWMPVHSSRRGYIQSAVPGRTLHTSGSFGDEKGEKGPKKETDLDQFEPGSEPEPFQNGISVPDSPTEIILGH